MRIAADRVRVERSAPPALEGSPLACVHARADGSADVDETSAAGAYRRRRRHGRFRPLLERSVDAPAAKDLLAVGDHDEGRYRGAEAGDVGARQRPALRLRAKPRLLVA